MHEGSAVITDPPITGGRLARRLRSNATENSIENIGGKQREPRCSANIPNQTHGIARAPCRASLSVRRTFCFENCEETSAASVFIRMLPGCLSRDDHLGTILLESRRNIMSDVKPQVTSNIEMRTHKCESPRVKPELSLRKFLLESRPNVLFGGTTQFI